MRCYGQTTGDYVTFLAVPMFFSVCFGLVVALCVYFAFSGHLPSPMRLLFGIAIALTLHFSLGVLGYYHGNKLHEALGSGREFIASTNSYMRRLAWFPSPLIGLQYEFHIRELCE